MNLMVPKSVNYKLLLCSINYIAKELLMLVNIVGFLAAITSTISLIPQVMQMYKTRSVNDISIGMIINFVLTSILWIVYGVLITSWSVWLTNIFMLIFALVMIYFKIKYSKCIVKRL